MKKNFLQRFSGMTSVRASGAAKVVLLSSLTLSLCSCQSGLRPRDIARATNQIESTVANSAPTQKVAAGFSLHDTTARDTTAHDATPLPSPANRPLDAAKLPVQQVAYYQNETDAVGTAVEIPQELIEMPQGLIHSPFPTVPPHLQPVIEFCPQPGQALECEIQPQGVFRPHAMLPQELTNNYFRPDEYLCDGGDRNQQVKIGEDFSIEGLDLEDTIAHFDTLDGKRIVQPSNRVKIYAPRFAAVRKTVGVQLSSDTLGTQRTQKQVGTFSRDDSLASNTTKQHHQAIGQIGSSSPDTFIERERSESAQNQYRALGFHNGFSAYENFQVIRYGRLEQAEKARLAKAIQRAEVWTDNLAAEVFIKDQLAATTESSSRLQDITGVDERIPKRKMRIVKIASKGEAKPGDLIEFTIRFDNLGNEKIGNVTVMDNLTPRLEYVPDSAECSLQANFLITENEGESALLRWEIIDPMAPETGGVIRFKCLVR